MSKVIWSLLLMSSFAGAQTPPLNSSANVEIKGGLDFYYQISPQAHRPLGGSPTQGPDELEGRAFDRLHNQMVLNMAELSVLKKQGAVTFKADLAFGQMVDVLAGNAQLVSAGGALNEAHEPTKNLTQATLSYSPSKMPELTVTAGKFYTPLGFEVTKTKDNWQTSRSYTFNYAIPFWHQGMIVTYVWMPSRLSTSLYVLNSWDGRLTQERNKASTLGFNLNTVISEVVTLNYNYMGGAETDNYGGPREVHELNALWVANPQLAFAVDGVVGSEKQALTANGETARWSGLAFYAKYSPVEGYTLSPRYEIFDGKDGFALSGFNSAPPVSAGQKITSITLTNSFALEDRLELRFELRSDKSEAFGFFVDKDGVTAIDHQESGSLAVLYSF